jgi:hypothetical protein
MPFPLSTSRQNPPYLNLLLFLLIIPVIFVFVMNLHL